MLCRHLRIGKVTGLRILHNRLDLKNLHIRWMSHAPSINQRNERVSYSKLFLTALTEQRVNGFQQIITGDGSWFFFYCSRDSAWARSCDQLAQPIKQKIYTEKCFVSILRSASGIHTLLDMSNGTAYNTTLFTDAIRPNLIENIQSRTHGKALKGWLIQMRVPTIRGELKSGSRPQEPNAYCTWLIIQTSSRVTSSL
jgi:hypothetical protein